MRRAIGSNRGMTLLDALRAHTGIVATSADAGEIARAAARDASIDDAALLLALGQPAHAPLLAEVLAAHAGEPLPDLADMLRARVGCALLAAVPGCVAIDVDARLAFDTAATVARARRLARLAEKAGADRTRVRLRIPATWEGIQAARALEREGIRCEATLVLTLCQAVLCGDADIARIACPVGRIAGWQPRAAAAGGAAVVAGGNGAAAVVDAVGGAAGAAGALAAGGPSAAAGVEDPGLATLARLWRYLRHYGVDTEVVGTDLRSVAQALALAGCERLAIGGALLEALRAGEGEVACALERGEAEAAPMHARTFNEASFRWSLNEDAMATELLAAGIRDFAAAAAALERAIDAQRAG